MLELVYPYQERYRIMNHATQFIPSLPIRLVSGSLRMVEGGDFLLKGINLPSEFLYL